MDLLLAINFSRFHPLVVHLPIGILFFTFFLEVYKKWRKLPDLDMAIRLGLLIGCASSVLAAATGWWLANEGGFDEEGVFWHRWFGVLTAVFSLLLLIFKKLESNVYFPFFMLTVGMLIITGHYGGNMTHGEGYLFSGGEAGEMTFENMDETNVYEAIIAPIFKDKCIGCHNAGKKKGGLLMTTPEALVMGGDNGPIFNLNEPRESEMLLRLHLPKNEKEHMPPKGKRQLNKNEIKLLEWWVENKACFDCEVAMMRTDEEVGLILNGIKTNAKGPNPNGVAPVSGGKILDLRKNGIIAYPLKEGNPFLVISLSGNKNLQNSILKKVAALGKNVVELNLSNTNFSDQYSFILEDLPNLQRLQLQNTEVSENTIKKIRSLEYLSSLNLYGTSVGNEVVDYLYDLDALENLYCWQSKITDEAVQEIQSKMPQLNVHHKIESGLFGEAELQAPEIIAEQEIFMDSMEVNLHTNFPKSKIYYSLDGDVPNSSSNLFSAPFYISETASIQAIAILEGWGDSPVSKRHFIRRGLPIANIILKNKPSDSYAGNGGNTLMDNQRGSSDFKNGKWLGYQKDDLVAVVDLGNIEAVKNVFVSSLASSGSWIIFPNKIQVAVSLDGINFDDSAEVDLPETTIDTPDEPKMFRAQLQTQARYVKVTVKNPGKLPEWHPAAGNNSWIFVDEIIVN